MLPRTKDALKTLTDAHVSYLTKACQEGPPTEAMHLAIAVYNLAAETEELSKALGRIYMAIHETNGVAVRKAG